MLRQAQKTTPTYEWDTCWRLQDHCIEKSLIGPDGHFCSFVIRRGVCFKDPIVLYRRFMAKLEMGKVDDIALGYFTLFSGNYLEGERLISVLNPLEQECHAAMTRTLMNLRKYCGYNCPLPWHKLQLLDIDNTRVVTRLPSVLNALSEAMKASTDAISNSYARAQGFAYTANVSSQNHNVEYFGSVGDD